ncbi:hypothetical protein SEUCBS139899_008506 [Sporothrix eucalyptigena]|uniref:Uncharacterized protein n=1 Tax=Sporothrix eucalyptigena TaxID=1812306 RepID=A0ABP0C9N9_9PEZI
MTTPADDPQPTSNEGPPYPTFEFRWENQLWDGYQPEPTRNLDWKLIGPLETAVFVKDGDTRPPLYNRATDEWHSIASKPVCTPPVCSVIVHVYMLSDWERLWLDMHLYHSEESAPEPTCNAEWEFLEGHSGHADESDKTLLRCCDTERPRNKDATIVVQAANGEFVTVRDYVTTVHPWLMGLRGEIVEMANEFEELYNPLPIDEYPLIVDGFHLNSVVVHQDGPDGVERLT